MECHRCRFGASVAGGKFGGVTWERTPCSRCTLDVQPAYVLAYDEWRGAAVPAQGEQPFPEEEVEEEEKLPISVMRDALAMLLSLKPAVRDTICQRYLGAMYHEIAAAQGVTVAAVELRHKRALKKWPALRALFTEKASKQGRRKKHRRRPDTGKEQAENDAGGPVGV